MITFILLLTLLAIGTYLFMETRYDAIGFIMCLLAAILIFIHSFLYFTAEYDYEIFVEERNAFEQTLNNSREAGNDYETAAIVKEVAQWNQRLAKSKYNNKTFLLGQYVDDRIEKLDPIK